MAEKSAEGAEVSARILYWGCEGAGTSTNLVHVHNKLRSDHRGALERHPTAVDPTVCWESLPITLGELGGVKVHLKVMAAPGSGEQAPTRKQLLDRVDGVVLVIDSSPDRLEANLESFEELCRCLAAYGRSLDDVALVVQYNKRDLADDYTLEELHRKLDLRGAAVFETVAIQGKGVLEALTTISKRVIRRLRERQFGARPPAPASESSLPESRPARPSEAQDSGAGPLEAAPIELDAIASATPEIEPLPVVDPESTPLPGSIEAALEAEALDPEEARLAAEATQVTEALLDSSFSDHCRTPAAAELEIESLGTPKQTHPLGFAIPVSVRDAEGRTFSMTLRVQLDPAQEEPGG